MQIAVGINVLLLLLLPASSHQEHGSYSALCVVGKNENRYIREWVEYQKCLGEVSILGGVALMPPCRE